MPFLKYFGNDGRLAVYHTVNTQVALIFEHAAFDTLCADISTRSALHISGLGDIIEYNGLAATFAGPAVASRAHKATPGHVKVRFFLPLCRNRSWHSRC